MTAPAAPAMTAPAAPALTAPAAPAPAIELCVPADAASRLWRVPALAGRRDGRRDGRAKTVMIRIVWHDTADGELASAGLALSEQRGVWTLSRLTPDAGLWLPAAPAPVLGAGASLAAAFAAAAVTAPSGPLTAVAAFTGKQRSVMLAGAPPDGAGASVVLLEGSLRGVLADQPVCRLMLAGSRRDMAALAETLGVSLGLSAPRASLAAEALALARGVRPAPRRLGTAAVADGVTVGEALTGVTAHLADVMLHWASEIGHGGQMEPVHQMRVAVRRLRSALCVFRRAAGADAAWLRDTGEALQQVGQLLGAARDWDVFLSETCESVRAAFPAEARIAAMIAAAERKRGAAYDALQAYLRDPAGWRRFSLRLALLPSLRPWEDGGEALALPAQDYARRALDRRLKHVLAPGDSLEALPHEALHDVRKQAKRLRYAIEFFAPLFSEKAVRRYLRRMETLQEEFGTLNDGAVAAMLAQNLNGAFASGVVQGFVAASEVRAARRVRRSWGRFFREEPFWS